VIHLRPFRQADLKRLYEIDQVCFTVGIAYSKAELLSYLRHPNSLTLVAENDGNIAGFCVAQKYAHGGRHLGHIITIDVLPELRKLSFGRALMEAVEKRLRDENIDRIQLEVAVDNLEAQAFYERLGFVQIGRIPGYYMGSLDAFVMQKALHDGKAV
jgi:ribosomal-protein-alanine N-acetyltransferase